MVATLGRLRRALASASFAAISVAHAAGTLDPTFANGATTLTGLRYLSLAVSPDQRIAVAGTGWGGSAAQVKLGEAEDRWLELELMREELEAR